jgi:hypothetical protein
MAQRQLAAGHFIRVLSEGKRLINIDESTLWETDPRPFSWMPMYDRGFKTQSTRLVSMSIIAGVSSTGEFYYTVSKGANNSMTVMLFMLKVIAHLDSLDAQWRERTVLMLDNARYHKSDAMRQFF